MDVAVELAKTDVIGFDRVETYTKGRGKRAREIIERTSFNVKAWEIGLGALVLFVLTGGPDLLLNKALGLAPGKTWTSFDPFGLLSGSKEGEPRSWWLSDPFGLAEHKKYKEDNPPPPPPIPIPPPSIMPPITFPFGWR